MDNQSPRRSVRTASGLRDVISDTLADTVTAALNAVGSEAVDINPYIRRILEAADEYADNRPDTRPTVAQMRSGPSLTPADTTFETEPAPDTLNTEPGWTAPTTGTYQLSTGQEPRPICGTPNPAQPDMICDDVPHHYGVHDHLRTWWPADHYPPGAGPCRIPTDTYDCRLYSGHPGPCDTTNDHRRS